MQEAITLLTHVEAEAMVVATLLEACGGVDAVSAVGMCFDLKLIESS